MLDLNKKIRNIIKEKSEWMDFEDAKILVKSLGIKTSSEWKDYVKSPKRNSKIPTNPNITYKDKWLGWSDWLGNSEKWLTYEEAKEYVHSLNLKSYRDWFNYCKSGNKPKNIPSAPKSIYKDDWNDMNEWLGIYEKTKTNTKWMEYKRAKKIVNNLGIHSSREWWVFCASGKKPPVIPTKPHRVYIQEWNGFDEWLGKDSDIIHHKD